MTYIKELIDRIAEYLWVGGFWNPEHMEHEKVRDLLMDCHVAFKQEYDKYCPHGVYWHACGDPKCAMQDDKLEEQKDHLKDAVNRYEREKADWIREETMNESNSMMLKPFLETVENYQKEVLCNGKGSIASHHLSSLVHVKLFNKKTGEWTYGDVQWIEASRIPGCGCWDGIFIVAEVDEEEA
jgi:hypothetical protein